jgi:hypothetical protein
MTKRLLLAILALAATVATASAEIRVTISRFENNQIEIEGQTAPDSTVTIDGKFNLQSDGGGHFDFKRAGYKPPDCMSDIKSGEDTYSAVIAGCFGEFSIEREKPKTSAPPN